MQGYLEANFRSFFLILKIPLKEAIKVSLRDKYYLIKS
jgi:hypothetical protein